MDTGILIAVVSILLAIPLSVVANLFTPILRNWWASRSAKTLIRRIEKLETELRWVNLEVTMEDLFDVFRHLFSVLCLFFYSVALGITGFLFFRLIDDYKGIVLAYAFIAYFLCVFALAISGVAYSQAKRRANPEYKEKLEKSIASLKTKLEEKSKSISA